MADFDSDLPRTPSFIPENREPSLESGEGPGEGYWDDATDRRTREQDDTVEDDDRYQGQETDGRYREEDPEDWTRGDRVEQGEDDEGAMYGQSDSYHGGHGINRSSSELEYTDGMADGQMFHVEEPDYE